MGVLERMEGALSMDGWKEDWFNGREDEEAGIELWKGVLLRESIGEFGGGGSSVLVVSGWEAVRLRLVLGRLKILRGCGIGDAVGS